MDSLDSRTVMMLGAVDNLSRSRRKECNNSWHFLDASRSGHSFTWGGVSTVYRQRGYRGEHSRPCRHKVL
jgi:hypothetical protein